MAAKTVEADAGIHSLAVSVAVSPSSSFFFLLSFFFFLFFFGHTLMESSDSPLRHG